MAPSYKPPFHFIGIGGSGMGPLAELSVQQGWQVSGSDLGQNNTTIRLKKMGVQIFESHVVANLTNAKTVIYSSAINNDNPEFVAAKNSKLDLIHRSDFLQYLLSTKKAITIAGTHGKTTTAAMVTHVLEALGQDPWAAVGGKMLGYGSPARKGNSDLFVAEVDESDGTIIKYHPYLAVLSNIDNDHLNHFSNIEEIQEAFAKYLSNLDPEGYAIIGWDNAYCRDIGSKLTKRRLTYGFVIGSDVRAINYKSKGGETSFTAMIERDQVECRLNMIGKYNVLNALCALACVRSLELDVKTAAKSLSTFKGVSRRQSLVYSDSKLKIFDDYAHNPGKISACIDSLKESWPDWHLYIIFQAHRFSRLQTMFVETMSAFESADTVCVLPVYSAGEELQSRFDVKNLAEGIAKASQVEALPFQDSHVLVHHLVKTLKKPAIILTIGAGDVWKVAEDLRDQLNEKK